MAKKVDWSKIGLDPSKVRGGKAFCPFCHSTRKDKNDRSLSVNLQEGIYNCHYPPCSKAGHVIVFDDQRPEQRKDYIIPPPRLQKVSDKLVKFFEGRGISNNTLLRMKISEDEEWMPQEQKKMNCILFNYFRDDKLINIKFRDGKKNFKMVSKAELILYNLDALKGEKEAIIVEGEIDVLSLLECGIYNVVSVPNGASKGSQKLEYIDNCFDHLQHIEKFILAVDDDEAGKMLKAALIKRFGPERCYQITYPIGGYKDSNEVLAGDKKKELPPLGKEVLRKTIENAEPLPIEGVYYVMDMHDEMLDGFRHGKRMGSSTFCPDLDMIFKWKIGDINLVTDYANAGKTAWTLQMMLIKSMYEGAKWAAFSPENYPAVDFYDDLIEMYVGKHVDDRVGNKMTEAEYVAAMEFINDHFFYVYPEEAHDLKSIHSTFIRLMLKHGLYGVLLDPWNQLDHNMSEFFREDLFLSASLKVVKRFALVNELVYIIIAHPTKPKPVEEGKPRPVVDAYNISGGAMWANKADNIISHYRPNWHVDRTSGLIQIITQKIKRKRTGGTLGDTNFFLNSRTMRYVESISGKIPCDPLRALEYQRIREMEEADKKVEQYKQSELGPDGWTEVDTPGGDLPF